jgi:hypothetical protein
MMIMIMITVTCIGRNDSLSKVTSDGAQLDSLQELRFYINHRIFFTCVSVLKLETLSFSETFVTTC